MKFSEKMAEIETIVGRLERKPFPLKKLWCFSKREWHGSGSARPIQGGKTEGRSSFLRREGSTLPDGR